MSVAESIRHAGRDALRQALLEARSTTLALLESYEAALGSALMVPQRAELNPPLWELGHLAWFQEWWIARNAEIGLGRLANPHAPRPASLWLEADACLNSSNVPHATRWALPLMDGDATRGYLAATLDQTLALLQTAPETDAGLYFFRLVLAHEDMHAEAFRYMSRGLGFEAGAPPDLRPAAAVALRIPAQRVAVGRADRGFTFDNERGSHQRDVGAFEIDSAPVNVAQFNTFCAATRRPPISGDAQHAAAHLTHADALAYCAWSGRRLPTEFEWLAASAHPSFVWGDVWEWTASAFAPFAGFTADPYRDYSAPWFDGQHLVLKGASALTHPRMKHRDYRNFFLPHRNDVRTGLRTCALGA
jgi:gamma-glutamyl hercynylcysteine S-oxide synthase